MVDNYNIEYWLFNIISADDGWGNANYDRIINKIKGKRFSSILVISMAIILVMQLLL